MDPRPSLLGNSSTIGYIAIDSWISETESIRRSRLHPFIVGLDIEWRPSFSRNVQNKVATLQLCVGRLCLIVQLIHTSYIPRSLSNFLGDASYTFAGVGIQSDADKLLRDYGLRVASMVDPSFPAANQLNKRELMNAGLKDLETAVLGKTVNKPVNIATGRWDDEWLTEDQVKCACI
ncbi:hypothetical protein L6164_034258 [Bauhinia variegata]|uniref:Uncharacterized protein n=1 Tax=Bauhinia variegata TaxID=167791 RepID=A0ACB9KUD3_BAUVA|nr:hypothetical protein L6164_034258 [Bauhinia variegata]